MSYQNSINILPRELIEQIQEYVEGKVIYIPKKAANKKPWGNIPIQKESWPYETSKYVLISKMDWVSNNYLKNIFWPKKAYRESFARESNEWN